jgi:hypothetical protein
LYTPFTPEEDDVDFCEELDFAEELEFVFEEDESSFAEDFRPSYPSGFSWKDSSSESVRSQPTENMLDAINDASRHPKAHLLFILTLPAGLDSGT